MKSKNKSERRTLPLELRIAPASADGTRLLTGTAIVFNARSQDMGGFTEVVSPTSVPRNLGSGSNILLLNNHNTSEVLGSTRSKTLTITTDTKGVHFSCPIDMRQSYAADLAVSVERGDTQGNSFGFFTKKDSWKNEGGMLTRTLQDIDVFELSVCSKPAYTQTGLSVRSCPVELRSMLKRSLEDDGDEDEACDDPDCPFCSIGDFADCPNNLEDEDEERSLWNLNMRLAIASRR